MTITECSHGMPTPKSCVDCMADGPVTKPRTAELNPTAERTMPARHTNRCPTCRGTIEQGDSIGFVQGIGWVCPNCHSTPQGNQ